MTGNQVAADPVRQTQGLFKIDRTRCVESGRVRKTLCRDVHRKAIGRQFDDRHASPLYRNRVANGDIAQIEATSGD